jgi:hypothetical protein
VIPTRLDICWLIDILKTFSHSRAHTHRHAGVTNVYRIPPGRVFYAVHWTFRCACVEGTVPNTDNQTLRTQLWQYVMWSTIAHRSLIALIRSQTLNRYALLPYFYNKTGWIANNWDRGLFQEVVQDTVPAFSGKYWWQTLINGIATFIYRNDWIGLKFCT